MDFLLSLFSLLPRIIKYIFPGLHKRTVIALILLLIFFITLAFGYGRFGAEGPTKTVLKQELILNENKQSDKNVILGSETTAGKLEDFEDNKANWDTRFFYKESDGYYCPWETNKQKYYYFWYKERVPLVGNFYIKLQARPIDSNYSEKMGEVVIKWGEPKIYEYSELYLPSRGKETVQYKQRENTENSLKFLPGEALTTVVKLSEPIGIDMNNQVASGNRIQSNYKISYISNLKGISITDPFSYPPFTVSDPLPGDLQSEFGLGTDTGSCLKIIKYCLSGVCQNT